VTKRAEIEELGAKLTEAVHALAPGDELVLCKGGHPIATVITVAPNPNRTRMGFDPTIQLLGPATGPPIPESDRHCLSHDALTAP
jgi:antitoxin (DNA-binding transcriptional repressor) of toxin-antitoxin stability system